MKIVKKGDPSNKTQTLAEFASTGGVKSYASGPSGASPRPFIDRMTVLINIPDEDAADINDAVRTAIGDKELFRHAKPWGPYQVARRIALSAVAGKMSKYPVMHYRYKYAPPESQARQLRLELLPSDLGLAGIEELHVVMTTLLPGGWSYVIEHGHVGRIEVTLDFPSVPVSSVHVVPAQTRTVSTWGEEDGVQTLYLGKPKSNQIVIYDRGEKRKAKGQDAPEYEGTRVEHRLKLGTSMPLGGLPDLKNPFASLSMIVKPPSPPPGETEEGWSLFWAEVAAHTLPEALKSLPVKQRTRYRQWLKQHPAPWWDPQAIWEQWPAYLDEIGIADSSRWW